MSQTQTTERDPIDASVLAAAITRYLVSTKPQDERDIALEAVLLEQGVINPSEAIEQIDRLVERGCTVGLFLSLDNGTTLSVSVVGAVYADEGTA